MAVGAGAAEATGAPCAADKGTAMNNSIAVLTKPRAADCGSLKPGILGTRTPRAREISSAAMEIVRNTHAVQTTILTKPSARVPSSGLDRANLIVSSEGIGVRDRVGADCQQDQREPYDDRQQGDSGKQSTNLDSRDGGR